MRATFRTLLFGVVVSVPACFFDLPDPVRGDGAPGAGGTATAGGSGGDASVAGAGGSDDSGGTNGAFTCSSPMKSCAGSCVEPGPDNGCDEPTCEPCAITNGTARCEAGKCAIDQCNSDFGDCDGEVTNGCEVDFAALGEQATTVSSELVAPRLTPAPAIDARDDDWNGAAIHAIAEVCSACTTQGNLAAVREPRVVPEREDLSAFFRIAHDDFFLYVLAQIRDDVVVAEASGTYSIGPAAAQDGLEVLIDGDGARGSIGNNDHQLFIPVGPSDVTRTMGGAAPMSPTDIRLAIEQGVGCYAMEMGLSFEYIAAGVAVTAGRELGFTIAVNDWDSIATDGGVLADRESQLFSLDPGDAYWGDTAGWGTLLLE